MHSTRQQKLKIFLILLLLLSACSATKERNVSGSDQSQKPDDTIDISDDNLNGLDAENDPLDADNTDTDNVPGNDQLQKPDDTVDISNDNLNGLDEDNDPLEADNDPLDEDNVSGSDQLQNPDDTVDISNDNESIDADNTNEESACLSNGLYKTTDDYLKKGTFEFTRKTLKKEIVIDGTKANIEVITYIPAIPEGCKVPVLHFSNGTYGTCAFGEYVKVFEHMASHGFIVSCFESQQTGSGKQCMNALDIVHENYENLVADKIGSMGHSQGGGGSLACIKFAQDKWGEEKIFAVQAIEPAHGMNNLEFKSQYPKINSSVFILSGDSDLLVSHEMIEKGYVLLNSETYWFEAKDTQHILGISGPINNSAIPWFRWKLLSDAAAGKLFNELHLTDSWTKIKSKNIP